MNIPESPWMPIWAIPLILVIVLTQGVLLFLDARKHHSRWYWFWGLWGCTTFPMPTLLYLIFDRKVFIRKQSDEKNSEKDGK
jgi:hypothetical protein